MSQKSITSFFKPKVSNGQVTEDNKCKAKENNILEKGNGTAPRKRRRIIESSSDEDDSNQETALGDSQEPKRKSTANVTPKKEESESLSEIKKNTPNRDATTGAIKTPQKVQSDSVKMKDESLALPSTSESIKKEVTKEEIANDDRSSPEIKKSSKPGIKVMESLAGQQQLLGADYNPAKNKYHPVNDAYWKQKQSTPYLALARTFQQIEEISGRLRMIEVLSNFFSSVIVLNPEDLLPCVYLSINQIAPAYEGFELGVAEHSLMKIICTTTGRDLTHIKAQTHITGDLGIVAEQSRISQRTMFQPAPLTVQSVFQRLRKIAKLSGPAKSDMIRDIFVACRCSEARFFIRSLIGKLRIGIAEQSLLQALALAIVRTPPTTGKQSDNDEHNEVKETKTFGSLSKTVVEDVALTLKIAYSQCPNYDKIIPTLLAHGIAELRSLCPMAPGIPIKPMLAQPTRGVQEVLQRLEGMHITCEWKYDGERAQIHCDADGTVNVYSRNLENLTSKYPDIVTRVVNFRRDTALTYIVDGEIVAWDVERRQILPFQVLSTRKRKNVDVNEIKVQVCVYAFDLLYLNGEPLVTQTLSERRRQLREHFQEFEGEWKFATAIDTSDVDEVQQFLEESIKGNCEGLMIKTLEKEATYEIAKRSRNWLKLKKDYLSGVGDSLDLVVIGGYRGKGKRTGIYGGFLLACYDADNEEYQSICKIGTGFSEEDLRTHSDYFKDHLLSAAKSYYRYDNSLEPDVWFEAVQVWEVKCADLSLSPVHKAAVGIIDPERGISLRFPRFIRIRDDKTPEIATAAQQVADMYASQDQIKNQANSGGAVNEFENDFY